MTNPVGEILINSASKRDEWTGVYHDALSSYWS